ncbi:CsgG/HfaB family protein [Pelosinus sp. sgz500959]|uniref:CsgG/HfaB family protein n=1 Tax=Pelosinus sp. sgz500959 TaxID=3242472 RepID=UPI00366C1E4B
MTKRVFLYLLVICFSMTIIPNVIFANGSISQKKIGVLRLKNDTSFRHFGQTAADVLTADLVKLKSCSVVERGELDRVFDEQRLGAQGYLDPATVSDLGGILGLDYLLMGTVSGNVTTEKGHYDYNKKKNKDVWIKGNSKNTVSLILRLVDVKTGQIVWSDQKSITNYNDDMNASLEEAAYDSIRTIYKFIPVQGYVLKAEGRNYFIDLGTVNNIAVNDTLVVNSTSDTILHPVTGELIVMKKNIGFLTVTEVFEKMCIAVPRLKDDGTQELYGKVNDGDSVTRELHKKTRGFLGIGWSGKHDF